MIIELSKDTYRAIVAVAGNVSGFVEQAARDALKKSPHVETPRFDVTQVLSEARDLQGMFGKATLKEVLADRRWQQGTAI